MQLGQASNDAERAVEAAIARVDEWRKRPLHYKRIMSGNTNANWTVRLEDEAKTYFLKVHGVNTELFIDRELAHEASVKVALAGHAPRVLHHFPEMGVEIHEFLEGFRSCTVADSQDPETRANIGKTYRAIHEAVSLSRTKTGFDQLDERLSTARSRQARLPKDLDYLLWQVDRARQAVTAAGMPLCACFNDAYITNYMVDAERRVKIIDWEYASNNDPHWDLAVFSIEAFLLGTPGLRELIEVHDGKYTKAAEARITLYYGVGCMVWACWAALQARISVLPYDFSKYSDAIFLRGRQCMAHPDWDAALTQL